MKTLIAVSNSELRGLFFRDEVVAELEAFSLVDWVEADQPFTSKDLAERIGDYDACITTWGSPKFTPEAIQAATKLQYIGHAAGSVVAVVNEDIFDTSITVTTANKALAKSTAESAVAFMMAGAWNLKGYLKRMENGGWSNNSGETVLGLSGRTVGLIGYGEISRHVIKLLSSFGTKTLLYSRYAMKEEAEALGVELCGLDELLSRSNIVSLHSTWTPSSEGMIGSRELKLIRDGALFINTARGALVDEEALVAELSTGRFSAALDVYLQEPVAKDNPLLSMPNVMCFPHIGGFHGALKTSFGQYVIRDLKRFVDGQEPEGRVTREIYKRLTPR